MSVQAPTDHDKARPSKLLIVRGAIQSGVLHPYGDDDVARMNALMAALAACADVADDLGWHDLKRAIRVIFYDNDLNTIPPTPKNTAKQG